MAEKGFIIDIIPLTRLPLNRQQYFSYLWETELPVGTLVDVPLFRRNVRGIVLGSRSDFHRLGNFKLRRVNAILGESVLTESQLALADFISESYFTPLGIVLKSFIVQEVKERKKPAIITTSSAGKIKLTAAQTRAVKLISSKKSAPSKYLLFGPASSGKTEVYIQAIRHSRSTNPAAQSLILLPELVMTSQILDRLSAHFDPAEVVTIHSKLSKGQLSSVWQKIRSGQAKVIIGSRLAIFAPFRKLSIIAVDEEQDISFKQWDMAPRYDVHAIASFLGKLFEARVVLASATPKIETYYAALRGEYALIALPRLETPNHTSSSCRIEIVDMRKEHWKKKGRATPIISESLKSEIAFFLKHGRQILLFINRRGMSAFSVCAKCRAILRCPRCERALIYNDDGTYRCVHCNYQSDIFPACPDCRSNVFQNIGLGTERIVRELGKIFPNARLGRADNLSMRSVGAQQKLYDSIKENKLDIIVGTQIITKGWDLPNIGLVGIIDMDSLLSLPDFTTNERAFQNAVQMTGRVNRPGSNFPGKALIQTYQPNHTVVQAISQLDFGKFYETEIADRESLNYPPFSRIIKLIFQDVSQKKVNAETDRIHGLLLKTTDSGDDLRVSDVHSPVLANIRGKTRRQIVLRITGPGRVIPKNAILLLKQLGPGWIIDVDPIGIS